MSARWTMLALLVPALAAGCAVNPVTGHKEVNLFTTADEVQLGRDAAPDVEKEYGGKLPDPTLQVYVDSVGQKIARVSHRRELTYHYAVLSSDVPNAFALPGGYIYITRGLLANLKNEAQLAAVLGHETGHVTARHGVQQLQRNLGFQVLVDAVGSATKSKDVAAVARVAANLTSLRYSRQDEQQSDDLGMQYAYQAGYNPQGMVQLLEVLQSLQATNPPRWTAMFQTHPLTSARIQDAQKYILDHYPDADRNTSLRYDGERFLGQTQALRAVSSPGR